MKGVILYSIKETKNSEAVGFAVYYNGAIKNVKADLLYKTMADNPGCVVNAEIVKGSIVGTQGSLDRYTAKLLTRDWSVYTEYPIVILAKASLIGYTGKRTDQVVQVFESNANRISLVDINYLYGAYLDVGIANGELIDNKGHAIKKPNPINYDEDGVVTREGPMGLRSLGSRFQTIKIDQLDSLCNVFTEYRKI